LDKLLPQIASAKGMSAAIKEFSSCTSGILESKVTISVNRLHRNGR